MDMYIYLKEMSVVLSIVFRFVFRECVYFFLLFLRGYICFYLKEVSVIKYIEFFFFLFIGRCGFFYLKEMSVVSVVLRVEIWFLVIWYVKVFLMWLEVCVNWI